MAAKSKELMAFYRHFQANCSVKVEMALEERMYPHWKRLVFHKLDHDDLVEIAQYLRDTFRNEGRFSHLLPTIGTYNGFLCLTIDISQIKEKILTETK
jgi:hypothetical protein